ncbi:hypothetical protein N9W19_00195 [bacterium]|nr:hypothetical protein [bacterium]
MKKTLITIWAYNYYTKFVLEHEFDNAESVEKAIVDKLGENSVKWEYLGNNYSTEINRITYEEVIDDTRPIQSKKVLGVEVGTGASG